MLFRSFLVIVSLAVPFAQGFAISTPDKALSARNNDAPPQCPQEAPNQA